MKIIGIVLSLCIASTAAAQLSVVSTVPANNTTSVPLTTTLSVTFSEAIDSNSTLTQNYGIIMNADTIYAEHISADHRTYSFDVGLAAGKTYFLCVFAARAQSGATLPAPSAFYFTTAASFPPYTVSGTVSGGTTGVSPAYALVILSNTSFSAGEPDPVTGTIADASGNFTIPYAANGTYYPLAAKDATGDGQIDPGMGDAIATSDPVVVNNGNVSGLSLTFIMFMPLTFHSAFHLADSVNAGLPPGNTLRFIQANRVDTIGQSAGWTFGYLSQSQTSGYMLNVSPMMLEVQNADSFWCNMARQTRPVSNPAGAASSTTFVTNVENAGGREFRAQHVTPTLRFNAWINLGDLRLTGFWGIIPDTSLNYWGAMYTVGYDSSNYWVSVETQRYLGDYTTGAVLVVNGVESDLHGTLPSGVQLMQNYPNPFNPTTTIRYALPVQGHVTLKIYDLLGREIRTLVDAVQEPGYQSVDWNSTNSAGQLVGSGVYFYRLVADGSSQTHKLVVQR